MSFKILDMLCMKFCNPSNPCGERSLARGRLNALALCFLANAFALLKINNCHCGLDPQSQELSISSIAFPSSLRRDFVMLNLFQHLTSLACSLFINKILKQVQDDTIRNFRKELFNSCESSPHPNLTPSWFLLKERERAWIFYTSLKDDCKKERENPVTNLTPQYLNVLTPLSQCKTWRTLPC